MIKHSAALFAAGLVLIGAVAHTQPDRSKKPAPGPVPAVSFPAYHESTLENGLKLIVIEDRAQPVVTLRLLIKSGSEFDGREKSGIAYFVTGLLTQGTATRSAEEFAAEADMHGLSISASAADDAMSVSGSGLKKHMPVLLRLMTDAVFNPVFPEVELEKARKQTLSGLAVEKKSPGEISTRLEITVGFNDHPYSNFGTEAGVKSITRDDIVAFHRRFFIPNNASLAVIGDIKPDEAAREIKRYFGSWKKGETANPIFPEAKPIRGISVHLTDLGSSQTQTALSIVATGMKRNNPDWTKFSILNSILGGGSSGRLYNNLREKHGFTYGAYSSMDGRRQAGIWTASAEVRRVATDSAVREILSEIRRVNEERVPSDELEMHKQYLAGTFLLSLENPATTAVRVQEIDLYGLPKDYYRTYVSNIASTKPDDIMRLARMYLPPDNLAVTAVGDAASIYEALKKFGHVHMYDTDMKRLEGAEPSAADIDAPALIGKMIHALGGREKLAAVADRTLEGDVILSIGGQEIPGTILDIKKLPNKNYQLVSLLYMGQKMLQEKWNDGENVISTNPMQTGPVVLEGEELAQELEKDQFNDILRMEQLGYKARVKSSRKMDGRKVYVLEIEKKHGSSVMLVDADTYLIAGEESSQNTPQGDVTATVYYEDYKPVDGVQTPHTMRVEAGATIMTVKATSIRQNTGVKDEVFKP